MVKQNSIAEKALTEGSYVHRGSWDRNTEETSYILQTDHQRHTSVSWTLSPISYHL